MIYTYLAIYINKHITNAVLCKFLEIDKQKWQSAS